jgi:hypothetical protein
MNESRETSKPREAILYISIAILLIIASLEGGWILGKWEDLDRDGKIAKQNTQIEILKDDMKAVKVKLKIKGD